MKQRISDQNRKIYAMQIKVNTYQNLLYTACAQAHNMDRFLVSKGYSRAFIENLKVGQPIINQHSSSLAL